MSNPKVCVVCREPEPSGGMRVGIHWAAGGASNVAGYTWQVCQRCMDAGRKAKRAHLSAEPPQTERLRALVAKWREEAAIEPSAATALLSCADELDNLIAADRGI